MGRTSYKGQLNLHGIAELQVAAALPQLLSASTLRERSLPFSSVSIVHACKQHFGT